MNNWLAYIIKALFISGVYFISGKLSLVIATTPGFAVPAGPAAGIALAIILLYGYRFLPSVFIGSFAINFFLLSQSDNHLLFSNILVIGLIASSALLQAFIGAYLVKRFITLPNRLECGKDIFSIILWGGLVACFINSILGSLILLASELININSYLTSFFTWWVGDTIGVILFTPIVMILLTSGVSNLRRALVIIPLLLFTALSILIFFNEKEESDFYKQYEFNKVSNNIAVDLQKDIQNYLNILIANESFINASNNFDSNDFSSFTSNFFKLYPAIKSLSWNPKVKYNERNKFEMKIRKEGFDDFVIKDRLGIGKIEPSPKREVYYPVGYISPYYANKAAHGYDTYGPDEVTKNIRQKILDQARDQGRAISTGRLSIVQDEGKYGLIIYSPVYSNTINNNDDIESRRENIIGYTAGVFTMPEMLKSAKRMAYNNGAHIILRDLSADESRQILFDSRTDNYKEPKTNINISDKIMKSVISFDVAGNKWELKFIEKDNSKNSFEGWYLWYVLIGGLLISCIFGVLLLLLSVQMEASIKKEEIEEKSHHNYIIPVCSGLITMFILISLWLHLNNKEENVINNLLKEEGFAIKQSIKINIENSVSALKRMALRWEVVGGTKEKEWRADAKKYINDDLALTTVEWVDNTYHVRFVEPFIGNEKALGLNIAFNDERKKALKGAAERDAITITPPLDLVQGYRAFISYIPIHIEDKFDGFIVGIYDTNLLFDNVIPKHLKEKLNIRITDEDKILYSSEDGLSKNKKINAKYLFELLNRNWEINIWPKNEFLEKSKSKLPEIILIGGGLLSLLVGFSIYYAMVSRWRSKLLTEKTIALEKEKKQSEIARHDAEKANNMKSEFLASMSHELRTPMNGIIGTTELLMEDKLTNKQRRYLYNVLTCAENLLEILNDILDFSKIESGKIELEYESFNLENTVSDVIELLSNRLSEKLIKINFDYDDNLPKYLIIDSLRIRQVFYNLIGNAIKFTEEGYVNISISKNQNVKINKNQVAIDVSIKDTGIGLSKEQQKIIFDKFVQADISTTRKFGGTGLGLSICRELVNIMGGKIKVRSKKHKGSEFYFTLVCDIGKKPKDEFILENNVISHNMYNITVLMAEDNRINAEFTKEILKSFGCKVIHVSNGKDAVNLFLDDNSIDIILMDCHMPEMDGWQSTKEIRKLERKNKLGHKTIIALTANAIRGDKEKCIKAGMDDYLSKPFHKQDLKNIISKWVSKSSS